MRDSLFVIVYRGDLYSFCSVISVLRGKHSDISAKAFRKIGAVGKSAPFAHFAYAYFFVRQKLLRHFAPCQIYVGDKGVARVFMKLS